MSDHATYSLLRQRLKEARAILSGALASYGRDIDCETREQVEELAGLVGEAEWHCGQLAEAAS